MTYYESNHQPMNLYAGASGSRPRLQELLFWDCLLLQIFGSFILAAVVERCLYSSASKRRKIIRSVKTDVHPVRLHHLARYCRYGLISRLFRRSPVRAVDDLSTKIGSGQITVLLGPNGSGKTTTVSCIAGLERPTNGNIEIESSGGLGICPQKNVFWESLTVEEHVKILDAVKAVVRTCSLEEIHSLIEACDLDMKRLAPAKLLSGGQKRKLQLAMMLVAGSEICCIDEVSSGLDPLSRRKIWNILLNERGRRTILLTTHFLDEADFLADHILILSDGKLGAERSVIEVKERWGNGYDVTYSAPQRTASRAAPMTNEPVQFQKTVFNANSADAINFVQSLEKKGITQYSINGPTIEDAFFSIVGQPAQPGTDFTASSNLNLQEGKPIGIIRSVSVLLMKRFIILRRNFWSYILALFIPLIATAAAIVFLDQYNGGACGSNQTIDTHPIIAPSEISVTAFVIGPAAKVSTVVLQQLSSILGTTGTTLHMVDTLDEFNQYIASNYANTTPGGIFLGADGMPPTFAYRADRPIYLSLFTQQIFDSLISNITTHVQYQAFSAYDQPGLGDSLQFILYFGLALVVYPALFALYPTAERRRSIRALQYSNGVHPLPLWLSHTFFDFMWVIIVSVITTILLSIFYSHWYQQGYLFIVLLLYGLSSTLLSYIVSVFANSQLSAFAFSAGGQAVMYLIYMIAYLSILTENASGSTNINNNVNTVHFLLALFLPVGNLARALLISLNTFAITCRGNSLITYGGDIDAFGGPIFYLTLQTLSYFTFLVWWDSGAKFWAPKKPAQFTYDGEAELIDHDIIHEVHRVETSDDSLRVLHASKAFGNNIAVSDVSFGSADGAVFALLGPNGAGKTTLISLIRGDLRMQDRRGEVFLKGISVSINITEHLKLYGKLKGVQDIDSNVRDIFQIMGLEPYATRLASKLSGGWKRKLSLGIAIMGNPKVLLLDEPSSGMDAVAKRSMLKTIESIKEGRSILLTTHSMEEANALASRAGILATRLLAIGTPEHLRHKYSNTYTVHVVTRSAPHTTDAEMNNLRKWVTSNIPGAVLEERSLYGQLKFSIPVSAPKIPSATGSKHVTTQAVTQADIADEITEVGDIGAFMTLRPDTVHIEGTAGTVLQTFTLLEHHKKELNLEYYSVSPSALEEVFLEVVSRHNVMEEGHETKVSIFSQWRKRFQFWFLLQ